ncbi:MAG: hypothetical protein DRM99_02380 [Thermoplasmata archaeon]|nr:MAG: hypothetical protein DRM99_02380 [Thermoplasmata archaeon]
MRKIRIGCVFIQKNDVERYKKVYEIVKRELENKERSEIPKSVSLSRILEYIFMKGVEAIERKQCRKQ